MSSFPHTDLGLPVLVDIFRMVSPSHVVQLALNSQQQVFDGSFLESEPGWRTRAKNVPDPKALIEDLAWFSSMRTDHHHHRPSDSPILIGDELDDQPLEDDDLNIEEGEGLLESFFTWSSVHEYFPFSAPRRTTQEETQGRGFATPRRKNSVVR